MTVSIEVKDDGKLLHIINIDRVEEEEDEVFDKLEYKKNGDYVFTVSTFVGENNETFFASKPMRIVDFDNVIGLPGLLARVFLDLSQDRFFKTIQINKGRKEE